MLTSPAWIGTGHDALVALAILSSLFVLTHFALATKPIRDFLAGQLGERGYRVLYSAIATALLALMVLAYRAAPPGPWIIDTSTLGATVTAIVNPIAVILLVGGLTMPNPTAVGGEHHIDEVQPVAGVVRITRHPVLWAIMIWALSHAVAVPTPRGLILFGTFAFVAAVGTYAIDQKTRRRRGAAFAPIELSSSNLPFLAIAQRRQSFAVAAREFGAQRLVIVVVVYSAIFFGHEWLFGAAPYG